MSTLVCILLRSKKDIVLVELVILFYKNCFVPYIHSPIACFVASSESDMSLIRLLPRSIGKYNA